MNIDISTSVHSYATKIEFRALKSEYIYHMTCYLYLCKYATNNNKFTIRIIMSKSQSVTQKLTTEQIEKIAEEMENKSAYDILKWAIDNYGLRIGLASSFGAEDVVIIDMMTKVDKIKTKIFTLDTGRLNQETYD